MQEKIKGLTSQEVAQRVSRGEDNRDCSLKTKTVKRIVCENIFTLFNLLNFTLAVALVLVGSFKNMLFMGVVLCNTAIGIIQEIRSKKAVDKLSIVIAKKAVVIRDGIKTEIPIEQIVKDDIIILSRGEQIPADCIVLSSSCTVSESLLTGESDLIHKEKNDKLFSGSFVTAGECFAVVEKVGKECYAAQINNEAKYVKKVNSEIMTALNKIIKFVSIIIVPLAAVLLFRQMSLDGNTLKTAVPNVVAALIGMIPDGLILLTSTVLAVSVIRLSNKNVLVQELYCIETLARVDVLCLDKTGTITADEMEVEKIVPLSSSGYDEVMLALSSISKSVNEKNTTMEAISKYTENEEFVKSTKVIEFSSDTKWSGVELENGNNYIIGAGEFINRDIYNKKINSIQDKASDYRVLSLVKVNEALIEGKMPKSTEFIAFVLIKDKIREDAFETIEYFNRQGVTLKVISGDNPATVSQIAKRAGIKNFDAFVDATTLKDDDMLSKAAEKYTVFGRVTPTQKKKLVCELKKAGHTVAMTGDGVNDVLALKEADCSIAMAAGSEAARNVSQLVLIKNNFSAMPHVVGEGRRTINNIQRSASLFLVKTLYAIVLALSFIFISMQYPFQPIQMTLISAFTIGIPSFVLALEPNNDRVTGNFLKKIISKAVPSAITVVLGIYMSLIAGVVFSLENTQISTLAVILTALSGLMLIFRISVPFTKIRVALLIVITAGLILGIFVFKNIFSIAAFDFKFGIICAVAVVVIVLLYNLVCFVVNKISKDN